VKGGEAFITIQSSALAELPGEGARVTAADARLMPKIVSPGGNQPALKTDAGAHHYRFVGIEFRPADARASVVNLVELGKWGAEQDELAEAPHHLVIDRCYLHGDPTSAMRRAVALNSAETSVINSRVSDCKGKGEDTQAVMGWNGPGPFRIVNNYLEGAGENVMFGGSDPSIPNLVPSDIEIRGNHFYKPPAWRGVWTVKNLFELKNARRVTVEDNLFENNWTDGQTGIAVLFTVRNQDGGAPWSTVEDVAFRDNVVRHAGGGVNILGRDNNHPSGQTRRVSIVNNLFEDISGPAWGGYGLFVQTTGTARVEVAHNTVFQTQHAVFAYGDPNTNFVFRDNVVMHNDYGVFGDGAGWGAPAIARYFPGGVFAGNVFVGEDRSPSYPPRNFFAPTLKALGFANPAAGDYRLSAASPYRARATDGRDSGCDFTILHAALKAAEGSYPSRAN
jgi:hypothetical protein